MQPPLVLKITIVLRKMKKIDWNLRVPKVVGKIVYIQDLSTYYESKGPNSQYKINY